MKHSTKKIAPKHKKHPYLLHRKKKSFPLILRCPDNYRDCALDRIFLSVELTYWILDFVTPPGFEPGSKV